jgi:hypothetical protein
MEYLREIVPSRLGHQVLGQTCRFPFMLQPAGSGRSSTEGNTAGDLEEPAH